MSFDSKNPQVLSRELKVQRLSIPFKVTHSATPSAVVLQNDEPSVMFMRSEGNDNITVASGALDAGETAPYDNAANDANGILNILIKPSEIVEKICSARVASRTTGVEHPCFVGDLATDGLSSESKIMLTVDASISYAATDLDACLEVEYVIKES